MPSRTHNVAFRIHIRFTYINDKFKNFNGCARYSIQSETHQARARIVLLPSPLQLYIAQTPPPPVIAHVAFIKVYSKYIFYLYTIVRYILINLYLSISTNRPRSSRASINRQLRVVHLYRAVRHPAFLLRGQICKKNYNFLLLLLKENCLQKCFPLKFSPFSYLTFPCS